MSSVLIRGMKMPKNCDVCGIRDIHLCKLWMRMTISQRIEGKHPDCPLVEVKEPHGRLIDADETIRIWDGATFEGSIKPLIEARPTVIEAEGREE